METGSQWCPWGIEAAIAERNGSADPEALALRGRNLVAHRSPITSRSNWAKESSTLRVSRPMLEVVLNDWGDRHERDPMLVEQLSCDVT